MRSVFTLMFIGLAGLLVGPILTADANHVQVGNERQEEYRAPWPQGYRFIRNGGCPIFADIRI